MMETILIPGAEIYYDRSFLPAEEATFFFNLLLEKCAWKRRKTWFNYAVPCDEAYYGDPGTNYTYSRREYKPLTWIPELLSLRTRVEEATPANAYSTWVCRAWATTPCSATATETKVTASGCMRTQNRKWDQ